MHAKNKRIIARDATLPGQVCKNKHGGTNSTLTEDVMFFCTNFFQFQHRIYLRNLFLMISVPLISLSDQLQFRNIFQKHTYRSINIF